MNDAQRSEPEIDVEPTPSRSALAHPSSMSQRLGWLHRRLSAWAFAFAYVDPKFVERVRRLAPRGSIVYVMRHRSVADYLLVRSVLAREGLPLPEFANQLAIGWFRPLSWIAARIRQRLRSLHVFGQTRRQHLADRETASRLVAEGRPVLIFLRARAAGLRALFRPDRALDSKRIGDPYLDEVLRAAVSRPAFIVPLAPFRGRGYRRRTSRLATLVYSVQEAPNELKKLVTFLFNRRDLSLTVGEEIDLRDFLDRYGREGPVRLIRRLTRALQLFLYREERVVWGPPLLPKRAVRRIVIHAPDMRRFVERNATARGLPVEKVRREAESYFDEMASNFNGTYFAILAFVFRRIWNRIFLGVKITGLDRVAERIREHPVVLVPCHRSHFDYLILSYIFHSQFLSPPHIAAGINLSFFPLGMLFRGAGAFFIRRTFEGNDLYKAVFRRYLTYLIREGYTQEFFIEGGRSRTGKILTPKLGMLSAIVDAFLHGVRRDLYFVPVSITYERLVEEEAYKRELMGAAKEKETLLALIRARSVLKTNYGKAFVVFGEPISLQHELGALKRSPEAAPDDAAVEQDRRHFTLKLGFRLLAEVNAASVVSAPSIAATVVLSNPYPAIRAADFLRAAKILLDHAEREGARFTDSLADDRETFAETLTFLERNDLVVRIDDREGGILHVPDEKRINLDFYKNNTIHLFVGLALLSHGLLAGLSGDRLLEEVWRWLDLFRNEFVLPERRSFPEQVSSLLERVREYAPVGDRPHPTLRLAASILQNFREAYWIAAKTVAELDAEGKPEAALIAEMQRAYRANLLLGVLRKPEGNTVVTLQNALSRFQELGHVIVDRRGRRERWVKPGEAHGNAARLERWLVESVAT